MLIFAAIVFAIVVILPPTQAMIDMVEKVRPQGYALGKDCNTIAETVNKKLRPRAFAAQKRGQLETSRTRDEEGGVHDGGDRLLMGEIMQTPKNGSERMRSNDRGLDLPVRLGFEKAGRR